MKRLLLFVVVFLTPVGLLAEHPIDVQRLTAEEEYFKALTLFQKIPRRQIRPETLVAAGRSAWALGITEKAAEYFDQVIRLNDTTPEKRARLLFTRGMMEFQDKKPRVALLFCERALQELLEPSKLRGAVNLLWGDALYELKSYADAKKKYLRAVDEVSHELRSEANFRIALVTKNLGDNEEAISYFRRVPLEHERTPEAIRALAEISLERKEDSQVQFWLTRGRDLYPDKFLDSWVDYALVQAALRSGDTEKAEEVQKEAEQKYPPSDPWLTLLQASTEASAWKETTLRQ